MFWVEKNRKINERERRGTIVRHSRLGNKFHLKVTLLNFWINLTQKGYSQTKKMKITIKF